MRGITPHPRACGQFPTSNFQLPRRLGSWFLGLGDELFESEREQHVPAPSIT